MKEVSNNEELKNEFDDTSKDDTPTIKENSNLLIPNQSGETFLSKHQSERKSGIKKKPSFKNFKSVIPLLSDLNETGKLNFKAKLLRNSGKYTPMIWILHKKAGKLYITDATRYSLTGPIMASILGGDDIFQGHAPSKTIDIDSIIHVESSAYKDMTVFIRFTIGKSK